ncbi:hypothetical protein ACHQM5_016896 [Ranunculus cassubicifolius]
MASENSLRSEPKQINNIITNFFVKSLQIILESRFPCVNPQGEETILTHSSNWLLSSSIRKRDKWFNLVLGKCPQALHSTHFWRQQHANLMVVDILLVNTPVGLAEIPMVEKILERWIVQYESKDGSTTTGFGGSISLYNNSIIQLRSLYLSVRNLPAYKLYRDLDSSGQRKTFSLAHRVSTSIRPLSTLEQDEMHQLMFTPLETSLGRLSLSVLYHQTLPDVKSELLKSSGMLSQTGSTVSLVELEDIPGPTLQDVNSVLSTSRMDDSCCLVDARAQLELKNSPIGIDIPKNIPTGITIVKKTFSWKDEIEDASGAKKLSQGSFQFSFASTSSGLSDDLNQANHFGPFAFSGVDLTDMDIRASSLEHVPISKLPYQDASVKRRISINEFSNRYFEPMKNEIIQLQNKLRDGNRHLGEEQGEAKMLMLLEHLQKQVGVALAKVEKKLNSTYIVHGIKDHASASNQILPQITEDVLAKGSMVKSSGLQLMEENHVRRVKCIEKIQELKEMEKSLLDLRNNISAYKATKQSPEMMVDTKVDVSTRAAFYLQNISPEENTDTGKENNQVQRSTTVTKAALYIQNISPDMEGVETKKENESAMATVVKGAAFYPTNTSY